MKQDYTLDELQTEMTALAQLFDSVTLADPRMGLLDPATLQPLNKVAAMPALDAAGRGLKIEKAADGLRTVIAQGITVADTPCVLLLGMPLPRNLQADGAEDAFTRALSQMQDDLRRVFTGVEVHDALYGARHFTHSHYLVFQRLVGEKFLFRLFSQRA